MRFFIFVSGMFEQYSINDDDNVKYVTSTSSEIDSAENSATIKL